VFVATVATGLTGIAAVVRDVAMLLQLAAVALADFLFRALAVLLLEAFLVLTAPRATLTAMPAELLFALAVRGRIFADGDPCCRAESGQEGSQPGAAGSERGKVLD
jgi:hypothetical protein